MIRVRNPQVSQEALELGKRDLRVREVTMKRSTVILCTAIIAVAMIASTLPAYEVELNAVQFPEDDKVKLKFAATNRVPGISLDAKVEFEKGQAFVLPEVDNLANIRHANVGPTILSGKLYP